MSGDKVLATVGMTHFIWQKTFPEAPLRLGK
jgi:hypothetical protein